MTRISEKFPFMRELSIPAERLTQDQRYMVYQQIGQTAAYLLGEYGSASMQGYTSNGGNQSTLYLHNKWEGGLVVVDAQRAASHLTENRLGEVTFNFEEVGPHGVTDSHLYSQAAGRGPVRRFDISLEPGQVLRPRPSIEDAVPVVPQEALDMHDFMVMQTDVGRYVPISSAEAMRLQLGLPPDA